jgi:hypothetical protein
MDKCFFCKKIIEDYYQEFQERVKKCMANDFKCKSCPANGEHSITSFKNPYIEYAIERGFSLSPVNVRRKFKVSVKQSERIISSLKVLGIINEPKKQ